MKKSLRYIAGYVIGFIIFLILIPLLIYFISNIFDSLIGIRILNTLTLRLIISAPFFAVGILFILWSNIVLFRIGSGGPTEGLGLEISPPTKKLVTVGPYRYTRNPMILGTFFMYFGLAVFLDSIFTFCLIILFLIITSVCLKNTEEKRLLKDFGDEFVRYRNSVPIIIPFTKIEKR